jgi:hypothetical protein
LNNSGSQLPQIRTPYDDVIPSTDDPSVQFYIDAMRIYLGLYEGALSMDEAVVAYETLKDNPEHAKYPVNPTLIPLNEEYKTKILSNLQTLKKFNLFTKDSIKSALTFALLAPETPITGTDLQTLLILEKDPLCTLVSAAEIIGATPRTVARSIERLELNYFFRVYASMDMTAFGAHSYILFFTLANGVDWETVEEGFAQYPFTKNILKTTMADLGYVSFLVPGPQERLTTFVESVQDISPILFDYSSLHSQESVGVETNMSLFQNGQWVFSDTLTSIENDETSPRPDSRISLLECKGWQRGLTERDFVITSEYRNSLRDPPRVLNEKLRMMGYDFDPKEIAQSVRKCHNRNLILPFISFRGLGLTTNFCFEIVCDMDWRDRILKSVVHLPSVTYYLSNKGIVVWAQVPGNQQVEYYQMFRSLENLEGVHSVQPIMTILLKGSRSERDLIHEWKFGSQGWTVDAEFLNLASCFPY